VASNVRHAAATAMPFGSVMSTELMTGSYPSSTFAITTQWTGRRAPSSIRHRPSTAAGGDPGHAPGRARTLVMADRPFVRPAVMPTSSIQIAPSTPERWDDVVAAFGRRGEDPSWCWCQRFLDRSGQGTAVRDNREALRHEISTASVPPGLIAYVDARPVGWTRVMPRTDLPGVTANGALRRVLSDDAGAWWVTCFAIDQRYRRMGVARTLLDAAVAHAHQHRATAVEGHPVDTDALLAERTSGSALFTGTMRLFLAAGFTEIGRTYPSRPVMRREL
jgi:GNAT superfamily N-acetyltransferase